MLRIVGRLDEAELIGRTLLDEAGDRWRPLLLLADVLRWQGRFGETEKLQAEARELATNASRRATTAQHIGKRLFDQGLLVEAENEFATALELRRQIRAVPDLIESSRIAWERARR
ncbi:MAG: tetratricopeptide repeat protein [Pseudolysinimonas sp.]